MDPHASAFGNDLEPRLVAQSARNAEVVGGLAGQDEAVAPVSVHSEVLGAVIRMGVVAHAPQLRLEGNAPGPVRGQPDDDDLVHRAREHLAAEPDGAPRVGDRHDGLIEVELEAIVRTVPPRPGRPERDLRATGTSSARSGSP